MSKLERQAARGRLWGGNLSDAEVSGMVRMLTRDQIDHEVVCVTARDRINFLSAELEAQDALISKLTKQRDTANEHRDSGDFVISNAERIIAEKDALIQSMREALAGAPCAPNCASNKFSTAIIPDDEPFYTREVRRSLNLSCNCWKSRALAQVSASPKPVVADSATTQEPKPSWEDVHSGGRG